MRAFIATLLFAAAPIYLGSAILGGTPSFSLDNFTSVSSLRDSVSARDNLRDVIAQARDYAAAHPEVVQELKAHRSELEGLRSTVCASVHC